VLSFQFPKLAFLLAENKDYAMEFELIDIGLSKTAIANAESHNYYVTKELVRSLLKPRNKFSHKGTYGHALLMAGSNGKSGAAIIAAKAALRSGAGLLTVHSTKETLTALLNHLPEAMSSEDAHPDRITEFDKPERYDAIGFGPGVGTAEETQQALKKLLNYYAGEIVIDADGLNILSENKTWLGFLPANCILTPHPKEFERLCGKQDGDFEQLETLRNFSLKYGCIVVLKCAHSAIAMPDGNIFFNSSGNAGLAKAGSGDGLTGVILGLLSRGYSAPQAAILGTFIHGYAADQCAKEKSMESILITDVIKELPKALKKLEKTD
jgi:NAD(P)H-hydrate epimerase